MQAAVEVRPIRPEEYEAVGDLTVRAYRALTGMPWEEDYGRELADAAARAAHAELLVATDASGVLLGSVTYVPGASSRMAEGLQDGEAGMRMLAVDPDRQGSGAGRALVEACIARARAAGRVRLCLHTTPWMSVAQGLYERLGFRRAVERDWRPAPDIPLLGFVLELESGPGGDG